MKRPRTLSFVPAIQMPRPLSITCCSFTGLRQKVSSEPKARLPTRIVHPNGGRTILRMSNKEKDEELNEDNTNNFQHPEGDPQHTRNSDMAVYRRNGRPRPIGELPFDVSIITPPPRYLGRFQLDPLTHCGDILEHNGHHFEVKVVRVRYRFREGRYKVVGKAVEVKSLARKALEVYLEQKFYKS